MEKYISYLKEGALLANTNKNITLFLIGLVIINVLLISFGGGPSFLLSLVSMIISLFLLAADFALIRVFEKSHTKEKMTTSEFVSYTFLLLKKLILPLLGIGFAIVGIILVLLVILFITRIFDLSTLRSASEKSAVDFLWYAFLSLVTVIPVSLGIFTPVLYVLKGKGLVTSLLESIRTSLHTQNRVFLLFIFVVLWIITLFSFPLLHTSLLLSILILAIQQYCHICLYGAVYHYSKKHLLHE